jgi:hypothetical protein
MAAAAAAAYTGVACSRLITHTGPYVVAVPWRIYPRSSIHGLHLHACMHAHTLVALRWRCVAAGGARVQRRRPAVLPRPWPAPLVASKDQLAS